MNKFLFLVVFLLLAFSSHLKAFPYKPIKLIVYTKPGGAIDVFARKFQKVAKKYVDDDIVVVNKPGSGGVVALRYLLSSRSDGHTIAAITKSTIGKMITSRSEIKLESFYWLGNLVKDPESLIVNSTGPIQSLEDLKNYQGEQIWVGPATGGNDHIFALKVAKELGIKIKWIPYAGGSKAMVALMAKQGLIYVGNPGDVLGKKDLKNLVISSNKRLKAPFEKIPTFKELGVLNLDNEIMWRGLITNKSIPNVARAYYEDLLKKVMLDSEWQEFILNKGAFPQVITGDLFYVNALEDYRDFYLNLRKLGKVKENPQSDSFTFRIFLGLFLFGLIFIYKTNRKRLIPLSINFLILTCAFLVIFDSIKIYDGVAGAGFFPLILAIFLIITILFNVYYTILNGEKNIENERHYNLVRTIWYSFCFIFLTNFIGYYLSLILVLPVILKRIGLDSIKEISVITVSWILISHFIFTKLLFISWPVGAAFRSFF